VKKQANVIEALQAYESIEERHARRERINAAIEAAGHKWNSNAAPMSSLHGEECQRCGLRRYWIGGMGHPYMYDHPSFRIDERLLEIVERGKEFPSCSAIQMRTALR
jgi:hypothetical protein